MDRYNFKSVEEKWQKFWDKNKSFQTVINKAKKNFIVLKCFHIRLVKSIWDT